MKCEELSVTAAGEGDVMSARWQVVTALMPFNAPTLIRFSGDLQFCPIDSINSRNRSVRLSVLRWQQLAKDGAGERSNQEQ